MKYSIKFLLLFFLIFSPLFSQIKDTTGLLYRYGLFGSYNYNMHKGGFIEIPEVPTCCPNYGDGTGSGFSLGASFEIALPQNFFIGLAGSFNDYFGSFATLEETLIKIDNDTSTGVFEHYLAGKFNSIALEPFLLYNVFGGLEVFIGGHIGFLIKKDFEHYEQIITPADRGIFVDTRTRTRNYFNKQLDNAFSVYGGIFFGASYLFPMNTDETLFLSPNISYVAGLTEVIKDVSWNINILKVGLAIKYFPKPKVEIPPPLEEEFKFKIILDTVYVESEDILKYEYLLGTSSQKTEIEEFPNKKIITEFTFRTDTIVKRPKPKAIIQSNTPVIHIETQYVTEAFPILPVVFFDEKSDKICSFFEVAESSKGFSTEKLETNPVTFNKNIINIIGERMKNHPNSKITLKGYADSLTESSDCKIAFNRALSIRNILNQVWGIDTNRISIDGSRISCFPDEATFTENDSGFAENRRVEIISDDPDISSPIMRKKFSEVTAISPQELCFDMTGSTTEGISNWGVYGKQDGKLIFSQQGIGLMQSIENKINDQQADMLTSDKPLIVEYILTDVLGNQTTAIQEIPIVKDISNIEIQRLSLILFEVSSDKVPPSGKSELARFIKGIDSTAIIRITGYSDILGNSERNQELSENRARNTKKMILEISPKVQIIEVNGVGSSIFPPGIYSYKTPSERFLSRTVQIELLKKVE